MTGTVTTVSTPTAIPNAEKLSNPPKYFSESAVRSAPSESTRIPENTLKPADGVSTKQDVLLTSAS